MPRERTPQREPRTFGEPVQFGPFVLEKRIAVGGMSEVHLARPAEGTFPAPTLIIKRLLPGVLEDPQSRIAFETEARLHIAARHPNVVDAFEAGEVDGEPYLAMEYVSGVDTFRLMRRAQSEVRPIPPGIAVYIARELCKGLARVHSLEDEQGLPLDVVHRDVTPSNIYLSETGDVKLGDFGIARSIPRTPGSQALKGKYSYLAPEQVSGEPFDHRADLFSLAVVLSELLIGQPLFPGAGQLAVLLAIRDCRIDPLVAAANRLPRGLFRVLQRALAKSPADRFSSAKDFYEALHDFEPKNTHGLRGELAEWVKWAGDATGLAKRLEGVLRDSTKMAAARDAGGGPDTIDTLVPPPSCANVRTSDGRTYTDVPFAKLIELIVTGQLSIQDEVAMGGGDYQMLESIEVLARHLPPSTATTHRLHGPGVPDYAAQLPTTTMLEVLAWLLLRRETGVVFADRTGPESARSPSMPPPSSSQPRSWPGETMIPFPSATRKEFYLEKGRLVLVASNEPSELLGETLVRKGMIERSELDLALVALPRYQGRLGDTLIGLGLVDPVEVFRAIQSQGRARVADIFRWQEGRISFYRGVKPQRVDFRLDLELPELMLAGLEASLGNRAAAERYANSAQDFFVPVRPPPAHALSVSWPAPVLTVIAELGIGRRLEEVLDQLDPTSNLPHGDALRALEIALATGLVQRRRRAV